MVPRGGAHAPRLCSARARISACGRLRICADLRRDVDLDALGVLDRAQTTVTELLYGAAAIAADPLPHVERGVNRVLNVHTPAATIHLCSAEIIERAVISSPADFTGERKTLTQVIPLVVALPAQGSPSPDPADGALCTDDRRRPDAPAAAAQRHRAAADSDKSTERLGGHIGARPFRLRPRLSRALSI